MTHHRANAIPPQVKKYLDNWGAPLIAAFVLLLAAAAVLVSFGCFSLADALAVYGFYALVAGVVLQCVCFAKNKCNIKNI